MLKGAYLLLRSEPLLDIDLPQGPRSDWVVTGVTTTSSTQGHWQRPPESRFSLQSETEHNLRLEGLLLHGRAQRDFFLCKSSRKDDDIWATHFLEKPEEWCTEGLCSYLEANRVRIDKMLAHLTYAGAEFVRTDNRKWDYGKIHSEIEDAWGKFLDTLDDERRAWFD